MSADCRCVPLALEQLTLGLGQLREALRAPFYRPPVLVVPQNWETREDVSEEEREWIQRALLEGRAAVARRCPE